MELSIVSSQGEKCMMTLMVDLIILGICIFDRTSDMKKTGTGRTSPGGDKGM